MRLYPITQGIPENALEFYVPAAHWSSILQQYIADICRQGRCELGHVLVSTMMCEGGDRVTRVTIGGPAFELLVQAAGPTESVFHDHYVVPGCGNPGCVITSPRTARQLCDYIMEKLHEQGVA